MKIVYSDSDHEKLGEGTEVEDSLATLKTVENLGAIQEVFQDVVGDVIIKVGHKYFVVRLKAEWVDVTDKEWVRMKIED